MYFLYDGVGFTSKVYGVTGRPRGLRKQLAFSIGIYLPFYTVYRVYQVCKKGQQVNEATHGQGTLQLVKR